MLSIVRMILLTSIMMLLSFSLDFSIVEAKRFGGGRSIGNAPSTSRSFTAMKPKPAPQQQAMNRNNSLFGGMGGMGGLLTGLLAGSLLGSFLKGAPFSSIGFLDIIIFGVMIFLLYRLFFTRKNTESNEYNYVATTNDTNSAMWHNLENPEDDENQSNSNTTQSSGNEPGAIENFDVDNFIKGAKILFNRMQESWGTRYLEDIKRFTTKHIFDEISAQAQQDPTPSPITVVHLDVSLTGTQILEDNEFADVLFRATLQEEENEENKTISEIWRFTRTKDTNSSWKLDAITQV